MEDSVEVRPARSLSGRVRVPGDKSIAHRALLFGAVGQGETLVEGIPDGKDVASTMSVLGGLGVRIEGEGASRRVLGNGFDGLRPPTGPLDCGNSGTTMRLAAGLVAGRPFETVLVGDSQLSARPMKRILEPLEKMGARTTSRDGLAPLAIRGGRLAGTEFTLAVASAQVKSSLVLAGLQAEGTTTIFEPAPTRDHTERLISAMGAPLEVVGRRIRVSGPVRALSPVSVHVPGDFSSAAFLLVAGVLVPEGEVRIEGVGTNPTRTGLLDLLARMGARIETVNERLVGGEPVADLVARPGDLSATTPTEEEVVRSIDELPILAVAAARARGRTVVRGAGELRVKETDRIAGIVRGLAAMGARIRELPDGFEIEGPSDLVGADVVSGDDHRIAMALAVAGLVAGSPTRVHGTRSAAISYPGFFLELERLGA